MTPVLFVLDYIPVEALFDFKTMVRCARHYMARQQVTCIAYLNYTFQRGR